MPRDWQPCQSTGGLFKLISKDVSFKKLPIYFLSYCIPYRTKPFIGINIQEICDCQIVKSSNPLKLISNRRLLPENTTEGNKYQHPLGFKPVIFHRSTTEPHSHSFLSPNILTSFTKHLTCEYREKTTPCEFLCLHYKLSPSSLSTLKTVVDACWLSKVKCDIEQQSYSEVNWNVTHSSDYTQGDFERVPNPNKNLDWLLDFLCNVVI